MPLREEKKKQQLDLNGLDLSVDKVKPDIATLKKNKRNSKAT